MVFSLLMIKQLLILKNILKSLMKSSKQMKMLNMNK